MSVNAYRCLARGAAKALAVMSAKIVSFYERLPLPVKLCRETIFNVYFPNCAIFFEIFCDLYHV